jgi:katanin p60 ATPase-containing subunit A1
MDGATGNSSANANEAATEEIGKNIMVLAATNRPQDLDDALRRRLEKRVYIPLPEAEGRRQLFNINLKTVALADDIDWDKLVELTDGYSGADLANVCREAALMPLRKKLLKSGGFKLGAVEEIQDDINVPLCMEDLQEACKNIQKSVGQESLNEYAEWMKEFGA